MSNIKEPIWILHLCNELTIGGDRSFLLNYYKHIDKSKIQFAFVVQRDYEYEYDSEIINMGGRIHKVNKLNKNLNSYTKDIKNILINHPEYRIVHSHMNHRNAVALSICKLFGVPVRISHSHNTGIKMNLMTQLRVNIFKKILRLVATDFWACSKSAAEYLYGNSSDYKVIRNAIDSKKFTFSIEEREKIRKALGIKEEYIIGHVGNFSAQKNYRFIIDFFSKLPKNFKLLLVGYGDLINDVKKLVSKYEIEDRVMFLGVRNDIPNLMQAFDAFVLPSLYEGLGIVAIESQAAGLPTYCSDGVPDDIEITNYATRIPLKSSAEYWAEVILSNKNKMKRRNTFEEIKNSGYEITKNVILLEDLYLEVKLNI